jgi:hypothetical protein
VNPGNSIIPDWDIRISADDDISTYVDRPILVCNLIVLGSSSMKVLTILRVYPSIGNMVALLGACIKDIYGFLLFFMIFIYFIAAFYKLVGATFDKSDYLGINADFLVYIMQTTRNSIGDIDTPEYFFWKAQMEKEGNWLFSEVMIGIIWFIFYFSNIILLLVVLMNFLIAIVSETYSEVTKESINNVYFFRSQLTEEYIEIWGK